MAGAADAWCKPFSSEINQSMFEWFLQRGSAVYWARTIMRRRGFISLLLGIAGALRAQPPMFTSNRFRYVGGTVKARTSRFDWNTTVTLGDGWLEVLIAPKTKLRMEVWRVTAVLYGPGAERRVSEAVTGAKYAAPPALFGAMQGGREQAVAILFDQGDGKEQAVLLEGMGGTAYSLAQILGLATGKKVNR